MQRNQFVDRASKSLNPLGCAPLCSVRVVLGFNLLNAYFGPVFCEDDVLLLHFVDAAIGELVRVEVDLIAFRTLAYILWKKSFGEKPRVCYMSAASMPSHLIYVDCTTYLIANPPRASHECEQDDERNEVSECTHGVVLFFIWVGRQLEYRGVRLRSDRENCCYRSRNGVRRGDET